MDKLVRSRNGTITFWVGIKAWANEVARVEDTNCSDWSSRDVAVDWMERMEVLK